MTSILAKIKNALAAVEQDLENLWTQKVEPFIKDKLEPWLLDVLNELKHDIVTILTPYAAEALAEIKSGVEGQLTPEQTGQALALTLNKAAAAGIHTAEQDVSAEASAALSSVIASVKAGAAAANQVAVAQVASVVNNTSKATADHAAATDQA